MRMFSRRDIVRCLPYDDCIFHNIASLGNRGKSNFMTFCYCVCGLYHKPGTVYIFSLCDILNHNRDIIIRFDTYSLLHSLVTFLLLF